MREELDNRLCREFPNLYKDRHTDIMSSAMSWGFQCGDGWFDLIYKLSEKLECAILKEKQKYPNDDYYPCASTVKEKYAHLRFYMFAGTRQMEKWIEKAERKSMHTCEECGRRGHIRPRNEMYAWYYCACKYHSKPRDITFLEKILLKIEGIWKPELRK